jgi:hypothetical protein
MEKETYVGERIKLMIRPNFEIFEEPRPPEPEQGEQGIRGRSDTQRHGDEIS